MVAAATTALLSSQRAKGCSEKTAVKLVIETVFGQGITARARSQKVGSGGRSTIDGLCSPEKATVNTQRIG